MDRVTGFLICLSLILLVSCETDTMPKNSFRIVQRVGEWQKINFSYEGEQLVKMEVFSKDESNAWILWEERNITYRENVVIWLTSLVNQDQELMQDAETCVA